MRSKEGKYPGTGSLEGDNDAQSRSISLSGVNFVRRCQVPGGDRELVFPRGVLPNVDRIFDLQSLCFNPVSHSSFFHRNLSFVAHSSCLP